jgi:hypothetical protein
MAYKRDLDAEYGAFRWAFQPPELRTRRDFLRNAAFHRAAQPRHQAESRSHVA